MNKSITIFTDGSSRGNPGPGGWAAIISFPNDRVTELGGMEPRTTNNRMELWAVISALQHIKDFNTSVTINTDSSYVLKGATLWIKGWQRNNWITSTKTEVLNRDLWEELSEVIESRKEKITWHLVEGHIGVPANSRADEIATAYADGKGIKLFTGDKSNYSVNLSITVGDATMKEQKSDTRTRSNAKAYSYISLVDGEVKVHKTWAECEARVKGKKARFKKALSPEEEGEIIQNFKS